MSKEQELLDVLNKIIANSEPIKYDAFNFIIQEKEPGSLEKIESEDNRIGIRYIDYDDPTKGYCTSTLALMATITDVLVGKRLAILTDKKGIVKKFQWYENL